VGLKSFYHPQSNGAVERANRIIFTSIKKCLFDQNKGKWVDELEDQNKGKWVDELPKVVKSHNTSKSGATKFTPFRLLYGAEAMTPEVLKHKIPGAQSKDDQFVNEKLSTIKF
jgi:hypothetical protein